MSNPSPTLPPLPTTIANLPAAATLTGSEFVPISQNGVTVRATTAQIVLPGGPIGQVNGGNGISASTTGGVVTVSLAALPSADILVGNASNAATSVPVSGDVTLSNAGAVTIVNSAVSSAKIAANAVANTNLAQMALYTFKANNTNSLANAADITEPQAAAMMPMRNYLSGLGMSTAGSSATLTAAAGVATDSTNVRLMVLAAAMAKTTSAWAAGNNNGGLDTGSIANNTMYTWYVIENIGTAVDIIFSLNTASPLYPSSYSVSRRIGAWPTDSSGHWVGMTQTGDRFELSTTLMDINDLNPAATQQIKTLSVPTGVKVTALLNAVVNSGGSTGVIIYQSLQQSNAVPTGFGTGAPGCTINMGASSFTYAQGQLNIMTNTSAQIAYRTTNTDSAHRVMGYTLGWIDTRGKDL